MTQSPAGPNPVPLGDAMWDSRHMIRSAYHMTDNGIRP
jgi:hypothetical protein